MDFSDPIVQPDNPREKANCFSIAFFWWLNPFMWKGYRKKDFDVKDLYKVLKTDGSKSLGDRLEEQWERELKRQKESKSKDDDAPYQPSLAKAIIRTFGPFYCLVGIWTFLEECVVRILQPLFMAFFIRSFSPDLDQATTNFDDAYYWGACFVLMSACYAITHHAYFFGVMHSGMKIRVAVSSLIYRKALKLSKKSLGESTVGHMVNMLSNDVNRFDIAVLFLHYFWAGPLQLIIVVCLTWNAIGPSTLAGAFLIILFVPFQSWIGRVFSRLRMSTAKKTDERIRIMNEIINGIKVIKMYAWEHAFADLVAASRKQEIDVIRKAASYRSFNFTFFFTSTKLIFLAILIPFVATGKILTADVAFFTMSIYNTVRLSMTLFFPFAIAQVGEASVSIKRIQDFLLKEEIDDLSSNLVSQQVVDTEKVKLSVENLFAKWNPNESEDTLKDINFEVRNGEMCGIIGSVGSGKTSLLQAVLGEIPTSSGKVKVCGMISYASQEPWVFSGSVRHNVLFGLPFDEDRYWKVIEVCGLEHDIQNWEHGDATLVGDKGLALSGGQKARINLARAIYRKADIYLLDDPLSAVDSHVGKHLYEKCIRGFLKSKAVLLVTHQLHYLRDADNILVMKSGSAEASGTFREIMTKATDLSEFLKEDEPDELNEENYVDQKGRRGSGHTELMHASDSGCPASKFRSNCQKARMLSSLENVSNRLTSRYRTFSLGAESVASINSEINNLPGELEFDEDIEEEQDEDDKTKEIDEKTPMNAKRPVIEEEAKAHGSVTLGTYYRYFSAGGNCCTVVILVMLNLITHTLFASTEVWIAHWTNTEEIKLSKIHNRTAALAANQSDSDVSQRDKEDLAETNSFNMIVYSCLTLTLVGFAMVRTINVYMTCLSASRSLHNSMFERIVRAPAKFFDSNPIGRILNRFSKDMGSVDEILPTTIMDVVAIFCTVICVLIIVSVYNPYVIPPTLIVLVIFRFLQKYYLSSSRPVKRLEGVTKSPIFSQLSSTLHGLTTIRAYKVEDMLIKEFDKHQDIHSSAFYSFLATARWFGLCLDWTVTAYLCINIASFLVFPSDSLSGDVGVVLSSCMILTGMFQYGMRQSAEMENLMTSVERIMEYSKLETEAPLNLEEDEKVEKKWPSKGVIEFKDVFLTYGGTDEMVLRGLNFCTDSKEKIGIVGRTGAGKSSMIVALFRLTEPMGDIFIDGYSLRNLGLHQVRKKISIIPQDPILFTGTLRRNLDPFDEYEDQDIWRSLQQVNLDVVVKTMTDGLNTKMSEGGSNLSVGQRQLVCLARAILRGNKILVMDEATANVDPKTDNLIQETIRDHFSDCTVLTIAHRLHTVMDSDRILVLVDGRVEEFDTPAKLLENRHGVLSDLVKATDRKTQNELILMAKARSKKAATEKT